LKKAAKAIGSASGLVTKYKGRLQKLCEGASEQSKPSGSAQAFGIRGDSEQVNLGY